MSAVPVIPADVDTIERLDAWIEANAASVDRHGRECNRRAAQLRMMVAVMDRASEIGARQRAAAA